MIDTNILISALLAATSLPAHLVTIWRGGAFDLLTAPDQVDELIRVTRYPKIRERLTPALAGRLINDMRNITIMMPDPPTAPVCADPDDNYLLGIAQVGGADFLVTGDKRHVLALGQFGRTRIVTVRAFLTEIRQMPGSRRNEVPRS